MQLEKVNKDQTCICNAPVQNEILAQWRTLQQAVKHSLSIVKSETMNNLRSPISKDRNIQTPNLVHFVHMLLA